MFVVGLPSSARIFQLAFAFTSAAIICILCGVSWHPPPRSAAGLLDPCFKTGRTTRASPNSAPWRVVTDVIVGRSRRRTRALPALVLCPPRGRSGLRRTLRVPAALPRCWVRTRIAPRPPPLAAHPFPSVHMGRLSRLGWRSQCMLTQLWGCKHPERPRAQGATCRHAFCPARGSCWHWPPGSDCCRAPGRIRGPLAEASCRAQAAARCAHRAAPEPKNR